MSLRPPTTGVVFVHSQSGKPGCSERSLDYVRGRSDSPRPDCLDSLAAAVMLALSYAYFYLRDIMIYALTCALIKLCRWKAFMTDCGVYLISKDVQ
jgi:hypothetical protein